MMSYSQVGFFWQLCFGDRHDSTLGFQASTNINDYFELQLVLMKIP